jgi:hypothetical protein
MIIPSFGSRVHNLADFIFFLPQMALAVGKNIFYNMKFSNQSYALISMDSVCWICFLHKISTSYFIIVSGLCMPY